MHLLVFTDAGARGNPGSAAFAYLISSTEGKVLKEQAGYIGMATNNEAEYRGLIAGLEEAIRMGAEEVTVTMDSELVVNQMLGKYRVKASNLIPNYRRARELLSTFSKAKIVHASREHLSIQRADCLVNQELDMMEMAQRIRKR
jgi:ribonuclease HI